MGCGGNANARQVEMPKSLTFFGNILDTQTRSLMGICDKAGEKYILNKIEPLKNDNTATRYLSVNPTGHIPMIEEGMFKVLGGNHIIFVYLCKSKANVQQKLMPAEMDMKIKGILGWYIAKMYTPGQQLFRMLYDPA